MQALDGRTLLARVRRSAGRGEVVITDSDGVEVAAIAVADLDGLGRFLELPEPDGTRLAEGGRRRRRATVELGPIEVARLKELPETTRRRHQARRSA